MAPVAVKCEVHHARRYGRSIGNDARTLLKLMSLHSYELSVVLTGDSAIQELNRVFRGKDRPTDVLSFAQLEESFVVPSNDAVRAYDTMMVPLGDVVISVDTATQQAQRAHIRPESRLRVLLIHGLLHLLGYDHEQSAAQARQMFARERELATAMASRAKNLARSRHLRV